MSETNACGSCDELCDQVSESALGECLKGQPDLFVDDPSSAESKGLSCKSCEVLVRINKQSPDIAGGVHVGKSDLDVGAGDQGIV